MLVSVWNLLRKNAYRTEKRDFVTEKVRSPIAPREWTFSRYCSAWSSQLSSSGRDGQVRVLLGLHVDQRRLNCCLESTIDQKWLDSYGGEESRVDQNAPSTHTDLVSVIKKTHDWSAKDEWTFYWKTWKRPVCDNLREERTIRYGIEFSLSIFTSHSFDRRCSVWLYKRFEYEHPSMAVACAGPA